MYNLNCICIGMDQSTLIWFLGGISACIFFLFIDRARESKRISVIETKVDALISSVNTLTERVDLFLKTEIDTLKRLAER